MSVIFYKGDFIDERIINISFNNRAFNYGDGFFETIKVINSRPFNLNAHLNRINHTAKILNFNKIDVKNIENRFYKIITLNNITHGIIKLHISRVEGGLYLPSSNNFDILISIKSCTTFQINKPINLCFYKDLFKPNNELSNLKSLNSLNYVLAAIYAKKKKFDDAILFNSDSKIIETSNSNIFIVNNKNIYTPPLKDGCLNGTMKNWLENYNEIKEKSLTDYDVINADEVFISNARTGITSVRKIENTIFNNTNLADKLQNKLINLSWDL